MPVSGALCASKGRVLVLDGETRKAVPVVRALASDGWWVAVASSDRFAPSRFSNSCGRFVLLPDSRKASFSEALQQTIKKLHITAVFPLEDATITRLYNITFPQNVVAPLPSAESFELASDKWLTYLAASDAGVLFPKSYLLDSVNPEETLKEFGFPCIIKPRRGSGTRGVRLINSPSELDELKKSISEKEQSSFLVQEFIPHGGAGGACVLIPKNGKPVVFTFRRLREYPPSGGPSTLRRSEYIPEIESYAIELLTSIGWKGLAMVEFRRHSSTGKWFLMEINPRIWGSIALAIKAGINFPSLALQDALGYDIRQPMWRQGITSRWWFGDILHFIARRRLFHLLLEPLYTLRNRHDILSLYDPLPFLFVFVQTIVSSAHRNLQQNIWGRGW